MNSLADIVLDDPKGWAWLTMTMLLVPLFHWMIGSRQP